MDPRRARDPRLARVDPRLQRGQSALPTPSPQQHSGSVQGATQWTANGAYMASQNMAPNVLVQQADTPSENAIAGPSTPANNAGSSSYKPRPLFCVVCASNQVGLRLSDSHEEVLHDVCRTVPWKVIMFCSPYHNTFSMSFILSDAKT
jgi:hypothetical protein